MVRIYELSLPQVLAIAEERLEEGSPYISPDDLALVAAHAADMSVFVDLRTAPAVALANVVEGLAAAGDPWVGDVQYPPLLPYHNPSVRRQNEGRQFAWTQAATALGKLEPAQSRSVEGMRITLQLFEPPLIKGPDEFPSPGAARACLPSDNYQTWTCELRPQAKWSDASPVTSRDFLTSYERTLNPSTGAHSATLLLPLRNAKKYLQGTLNDFQAVGVRAEGPHRLVFSLEQPMPDFDLYLRDTAYAPIPTHVVQPYGKDWMRHLITNGPYALTAWNEGDHITLGKNPQYWAAAEVLIPSLVIYQTADENTALQWYRLGKIQWTTGLLTAATTHALLDEDRPDLHLAGKACTVYLALNLQQAPLDDTRLRAALAHGIDRGRIARQVLPSGSKSSTSFIPDVFRSSHGFTPLGPYQWHDSSQAAALLAESNHPSPPPLTLLISTLPIMRDLGVVVQRQLKERMGIDVTVEARERGAFIEAFLTNKEYQLALHSYCCDVFSPDDFLQVFTSDHPYNMVKMQDPTYDAIMQQIAASADPAERNQLRAQAMKRLETVVPVIPIAQEGMAYLLDPSVRGFTPDPVDVLYFARYWWFE